MYIKKDDIGYNENIILCKHEDVYDISMIFDSKEKALNYVLQNSNDTKERIEEEWNLDNDGCNEYVTANVYIERYSCLSLFNNGICILWEVY
jgi:hypothetical protein